MKSQLKTLFKKDPKIKYWEFKEEHGTLNSVSMTDRVINDVDYGSKYIYSIRVLYNNACGFVSSDNPGEIIMNAKKAITIARIMSKRLKQTITYAPQKQTKLIKNHIKSRFDFQKTKDQFNQMTDYKQKFSKIKSLQLDFSEEVVKKEFYNSEDSHMMQSKIYNELVVFAEAKDQNRLESHTVVTDSLKDAQESVKTACKIATKLLNAKTIRSNSYPVILDSELTGMLIHEALGHAVEADHVLDGNSCLKNKLNKKIANSNVNVFDDPTQKGFGEYLFDDEGVIADKTQIIKNGILKTFLNNRETAARLRLPLTGNGRCETFCTQPLVRMSNTYLQKGDHSLNEMFEGMKNGIYLSGEKSGEVNTFNGDFEFGSKYGYIIKNGSLETMVKDISFVGNILKTLNLIKAIGNTYGKPKASFCEKFGSTVPVNGRNPSVFIENAKLVGKNV